MLLSALSDYRLRWSAQSVTASNDRIILGRGMLRGSVSLRDSFSHFKLIFVLNICYFNIVEPAGPQYIGITNVKLLIWRSLNVISCSLCQQMAPKSTHTISTTICIFIQLINNDHCLYELSNELGSIDLWYYDYFEWFHTYQI